MLIPTILILFVIAGSIVFFAVNKMSWAIMFSVVLLTFILSIFMNALRGDNIQGAVSSVVYPPPPHLGLNGIPNFIRN